ncbi:MAG: cytidylate kinase family protein [Syntrophobacteraceae bacterium]
MAIITISRGSYSKGKEVAEKVAEKLGYRCIARELIIKASKEFNIPEIKLKKALNNAPGILGRFTYGKERFVSYVQTTLLKAVQSDNVIYHGLAGHFFLKDVSHALKVRIITSMENRVRTEMEREGMTKDAAIAYLRKGDEERKKWSMSLYGIDTSDPILYDLVIQIGRLTVDDAVDIICHTVGLDRFKTTFDSQKALEDLVLAAEVKSALVELKPDIQVYANNGAVYIGAKSSLAQEPDLAKSIERVAEAIPGVKKVEVKLHVVEWQD